MDLLSTLFYFSSTNGKNHVLVGGVHHKLNDDHEVALSVTQNVSNEFKPSFEVGAH